MLLFFIQTPPRNDLLKLFGSKSSLHCTPVIIKTFSKSPPYRSFARDVIYLLCFEFPGNWEAGKLPFPKKSAIHCFTEQYE